jgi:acetyl-CoA acetyltransferase
MNATKTKSGNRITSFEVRRPGCCSWSDGHKTLRAARTERDRANRSYGPGHEVYAVHANGDRTGPYDDPRTLDE